jgi:hypothetical protein
LPTFFNDLFLVSIEQSLEDFIEVEELSAFASECLVVSRSALYPLHVFLWYCLASGNTPFGPGDASKQMTGLVMAPAVVLSALAVHLLESPGNHETESEQFCQELTSAFLELLYAFKG